MNAKTAHDKAIEFLSTQKLTQDIEDLIKTASEQGNFSLSVELPNSGQELQKICKLLQDRGFDAGIMTGNLKDTLFIRW